MHITYKILNQTTADNNSKRKRASLKEQITLHTTEEVSKMFSISKSWLEKNRHGAHDNMIPWDYWFGNCERYSHWALTDWLGEDVLELLTTKELAELLKVSVDWLKHNRLGNNPIPSMRFGGLVRYHPSVVKEWMDALKQTEDVDPDKLH
jgi:excisionase family DNA binding protein